MTRKTLLVVAWLALALPAGLRAADTEAPHREPGPEPIPVSGRVVDGTGHPRVDLPVLLERTRRWDEVGDTAPETIEATTDPGGVFRAQLPEPGFWRVLLLPDADGPPVTTTVPHQPVSRPTDLGDLSAGEPRSPGPRHSAATLRMASPEETRTVDESLVLDARVVREEDDRPVPFALVGSSPRLWTLADGEGRFRLPVRGTADADLRVEIEAPGRRRTWVPLLEAAAEPGGDVTLGPTALVAGHVVEAGGQPVAGVRVGLAGFPAQFRPGVRTGPDGAFALEIAGNRLLLQARHPDFLPHLATGLQLPDSGQVLDGVVLQLDRGFPAVGQVVDETGRPVPGATVWVFQMESPQGRRLERLPQETAADPTGRFQFDRLAAALYTVEVTSPDHVPHQSQVELSERSADLGVLELETAAVLEGMVLDPDFEPVADARIGWRQPGLPRLYSDRPVAFAPDDSAERGATSDSDGRFTVPGLAPDLPVSLEVSRDGYLPAETVANLDPDAATGTRQEPFLLVLEPAGELTGQVVDPTGEPIEEVDVSARPLAGTVIHPLRDFTDADGRFRLTRIPEGTVEVVASQPGRPPTRRSVEVVPGEAATPLRLVLEQGVRFSGRVVGADGEPLEGTQIALVDAEFPGASALLDEATPSTHSGPDGRFVLDGVAPGTYRAQLHHQAYRVHELPVSVGPGGGSQELQLTDRGLHVAGRVIGPDGTPLAHASVFTRRSGSGPTGYQGTPAEDDGRFLLFGLEAGVIDLYVASTEGIAGPRTVDLGAGAVDDLVIDLGGSGRVVGRVTGLTNGERQRAQARIEGPRRTSGEIEPDGSFEFDRLGPGEWTVYVSVVGGPSASQAVTLSDGGEVRVEIDLGQPGFRLTGTVLVDGEPRGGLRIFATRGMLFGGDTQTDFFGAFRIDGLEAGPYTLGVHDPATGIFHLQEIRLTGDREIWIEVEVVTVDGTVVNPATGSPVAGVPVRFVPLDVPSPFDRATGFAPVSRTDPSGAFRVGPLAAGRYRVVVGGAGTGEVIDLTAGLDVAGVVLALEGPPPKAATPEP